MGTRRFASTATSGDIKLSGADLAEEFDFAGASPAAPGSVLVIDDEERLAVSSASYDRRVAGVVSGREPIGRASCSTGGEGVRRPAIALNGKVFCQVDAAYGPIRVGDLLVSSATPGHAMAATDLTRARCGPRQGAPRMVRGCEAIPILVALQ